MRHDGYARLVGGFAIAVAFSASSMAQDLERITCEPLVPEEQVSFILECDRERAKLDPDETCSCPPGFVAVVDVFPATIDQFGFRDNDNPDIIDNGGRVVQVSPN